MYQQPQNDGTMQNQALTSSEQHALAAILANERHIAREYCNAATEANCSYVRQVFTELLQDTLVLQGYLNETMGQHLHTATFTASRQDIEQKMQRHSDSQQKTQQIVQETMSRMIQQQGQQGMMQQWVQPQTYSQAQQPLQNQQQTQTQMQEGNQAVYEQIWHMQINTPSEATKNFEARPFEM